MIPALLAAAALAAAAWAYLRRERLGPAAWPLVLARATAFFLLAILVLDLSCGVRPFRGRPLVLLDGSLSLEAAGAAGRAAADSARVWGLVRTFGDERSGDTLTGRGASRLAPALRAAAAGERPVIVVTDGELDDAADLPPDLVAAARFRVFPRRAVGDFAVTSVTAADRAMLTDTVAVAVEVGRFGGAGDSAVVALAGPRPLGTRTVKFGAAAVATVDFTVPARALGPGDHLLRATVTGPGDAEPRDDARWALVRVAETPGVTLVAAPGDWDSRQLYRTLREVSDLPVRGFVRLGDRWWTMDGPHPAPVAEVRAAVSRADLVVLKGDPGPGFLPTRARGVWRWPSGEGGAAMLPGDWYPADPGASPIEGAWIGAPLDSFPPLFEVAPVEARGAAWVGLEASLARHGAPRPVIVGRETGGRREVTVAADGFWRWAFAGGAGEQAYRTMVAAAVAWALGGGEARAPARPREAVVPRGTPLVFEWIGAGPAVATPVRWTADSLARTDTLHFDGAGRAEAWLPVGVYRYRLADGAGGTAAVEPWSREWIPRVPVVTTHDGPAAGRAVARQAARDRLWIFGLIIVALAAEWTLRRRRGLR